MILLYCVKMEFQKLEANDYWSLYTTTGIPPAQVFYDEIIAKAKESQISMYGKIITIPRKMLVITDKNKVGLNAKSGFNYGNLDIYRWEEFPEICNIKNAIESKFGILFQYCLVNLYVTGKDYISWHSDREATNPPRPVYSFSIGATRLFRLRDKTKKTGFDYEYNLENGNLLVMYAGCQEIYTHTVPKQLRVKNWRINFTFRVD